MNLVQLEMFVAVAEERSVRRAAERVYRTQPAVSLALGKLERGVGVLLLDRSNRRSYRLTPAGEFLYEYASRMIGLRDEVVAALKGETSGCSGRLTIGVDGDICLERVQKLTQTFREQNRKARVEISCDLPENLLRKVCDRSIDLAFLSASPAKRLLASNLVYTRLRGGTKESSLWVLQRRVGRSHIDKKLEELITGADQASLSRTSYPRLNSRDPGSVPPGTERPGSDGNA